MLATPISAAPMLPPPISGPERGPLTSPQPHFASAVPDLRQTRFGVDPPGGGTHSLALRSYREASAAEGFAGRIYHPGQAPSAIATENALVARSILAPVYVHDSAASKMARLSNLHRDAPRYGALVNLLA